MQISDELEDKHTLDHARNQIKKQVEMEIQIRCFEVWRKKKERLEI
jgi:hypothetical protein